MSRQNLKDYRSGFDRGRPWWVEVLWLVCQCALFSTDLPGSAWRRGLLRMFGAAIGNGVVIKPRVRVKLPWRLVVGDHSWIGEGVWIDNLATVTIGRNVCVSQGAYLCTGNHDRTKPSFDLITAPIQIEDEAWVGAFALVGPGSILRAGAVLAMGAVFRGDSEPDMVIAGNPAKTIKPRVKNDPSAQAPMC